MAKKRGRPNRDEAAAAIKNEEEEMERTTTTGGGGDEYEKMREKRVRENLERMHKLGIFDLASHLQHQYQKHKTTTIKRAYNKKTLLPPSSHPPRRSSRLVTSTPVTYYEKPVKKEKKEKIVEIHIAEGSKPEIYTEEDEELLGDCNEAWVLCVDGYSEDGERIYDPYNGKSCHQCRQKTLGHRTSCINCKSVQGQFCGDCLYTRYGENVLEAKQNPEWKCPVCRGICNCSRCRRLKGWAPTGHLHTKVKKLGFKSVAHYLVKTRRPNSDLEKLDAEIAALDADTDLEKIPKPEPVHEDDVAKHSEDDYKENEADNNLISDFDPNSDDDVDADSDY